MREDKSIPFHHVPGAVPMHRLNLVLRVFLSPLIAAVLVLLFCTSNQVQVAAREQVGAGTITGSYMLDSRPEELWFLSLTQVGELVSGYALVIEPDEFGELAQQQLGVTGSTDGTSISLVIGDPWSGSIMMNGSMDDGNLVLTFPTDTGGVGTAAFESASPEELNQVLADWQNQGGSEDQLRSVLLVEADMPVGLQVLNETSLTQDQVAGAYPGVTEDQLSSWGWVASVDRVFGTAGSSSPSDDLGTVLITLHQFGTATGASSALSAFATSNGTNGWEPDPLNTNEVQILTTPASGNGTVPDGVDVAVYALLGDTVADIRGFAFGGDPTADTLEVARRLYDPNYRSTVQELEDQISSADTAAGQLQSLKDTVQFRLDEVGLVIDDLQETLDDLKLQGEMVLDCFSLETLEFTYEDTMQFTYGDSLPWAQTQYSDAVQDLESTIETIELTAADATETLDELATLRASMPGPLTQASGTLFSDERATIDSVVLRASEARQTLDDSHTQYDEEIASADAIMAEGKTIVEAAQTSLSC